MPPTPDLPELSIVKLSTATGCKVETIRFYEKAGILPAPARTTGGQRRYTREHLKRLNFVRRARGLGFSLEEVRALLSMVDKKNEFTCAEVEQVARTHLQSVRDRIADLRTIETVLLEMVVRCEVGTVPDCPIIEALYAENGETGIV